MPNHGAARACVALSGTSLAGVATKHHGEHEATHAARTKLLQVITNR